MAYEKKFMEIAESEAEKNNEVHDGGPFGTVIVKDGKILAQGHNHVIANHDPSAHGEIFTIREACKKLGTFDLSGCELYTNAMPCPMCLGAIIWSNIKTCYYGNNAEDAKNIGFRDDFIYKFIDGGMKDTSVLDLQNHDRDMTMKSFNDYMADQDKAKY